MTWITSKEIRLCVRVPGMMDVILDNLPGLIVNTPGDISKGKLE